MNKPGLYAVLVRGVLFNTASDDCQLWLPHQEGPVKHSTGSCESWCACLHTFGPAPSMCALLGLVIMFPIFSFFCRESKMIPSKVCSGISNHLFFWISTVYLNLRLYIKKHIMIITHVSWLHLDTLLIIYSAFFGECKY